MVFCVFSMRALVCGFYELLANVAYQHCICIHIKYHVLRTNAWIFIVKFNLLDNFNAKSNGQCLIIRLITAHVHASYFLLLSNDFEMMR